MSQDRGHFAKKCKSSGAALTISQRDKWRPKRREILSFWVRCIHRRMTGGNESIKLNGVVSTVFKLDTGAAVTAIPSSSFSTQKHGALHPTGKVLFGPGNHKA